VPPTPCVKWAPPLSPCLQKHLLPNQNNFFSTYFHKKKIPKKRMITETKAKQKRKNYSKKSVLSLFPKQKEFNWPSDFNLSLSFTTLLSYCSVFQICTRLHSICGQEKQKLFSSKNSLFINAWDSRILKEKRQKKINKKQTDHPPVFTAIVLLIARMCPFKFF